MYKRSHFIFHCFIAELCKCRQASKTSYMLWAEVMIHIFIGIYKYQVIIFNHHQLSVCVSELWRYCTVLYVINMHNNHICVCVSSSRSFIKMFRQIHIIVWYFIMPLEGSNTWQEAQVKQRWHRGGLTVRSHILESHLAPIRHVAWG